jgi:hypothetical protein
MFNGWTAMFNGGAPGAGYRAGHGHEGIHALRDLHATESGVGDQGVVDYVVVVLLLVAGIYAFLRLVGFRAQMLTRRTTRTAEDMYENYADPPGKQKRYARRRGRRARRGIGQPVGAA